MKTKLDLNSNYNLREASIVSIFERRAAISESRKPNHSQCFATTDNDRLIASSRFQLRWIRRGPSQPASQLALALCQKPSCLIRRAWLKRMNNNNNYETRSSLRTNSALVLLWDLSCDKTGIGGANNLITSIIIRSVAAALFNRAINQAIVANSGDEEL